MKGCGFLINKKRVDKLNCAFYVTDRGVGYLFKKATVIKGNRLYILGFIDEWQFFKDLFGIPKIF